MRVSVACVQMAMSEDVNANLDKAEKLVRQAAAKQAQLILLPELFATLYFCQTQSDKNLKLAREVHDHPVLRRFASLAKELHVVLPVSFYEKTNQSFFNSIAIFDADGTNLGIYRKSHIPDGPGYQEKFHFNPGDTGFKVFNTSFAKLGVAICWDQWFPEAARAMALQGAEILMYPTAIGSEPQAASINSYPHWMRVMLGHAGANLIPLVASNRVGDEIIDKQTITFYGGSFIADHRGAILAQVGKRIEDENFDARPVSIEGFRIAELDLEAIQWQRASWGIFRDRRIDLYDILLTLDGVASYHKR